jgi:hypothetical protein
VPRHLSIPGATPTPQQFHVEHNQRKQLNLAVAICGSGGIFYDDITGSDYPGRPAQQPYIDSKGKELVKMGGEEYRDFLKAAYEHFKQKRRSRARSGDLIIVHDRATPHGSHAVKEWLEQLGKRASTLPPRSPDLMPLDYGIFGTVKQALARSTPLHAEWSQEVSNFKELLDEAPVEQTIGQFKLRLRAVIEAKGGHIDRALRQLKRSEVRV